ncbi:MAG: oligosaccharide flippase family protein [Vicinamibacterales bacterium]|nr:oligosaccharide flippase family protein [Vicinamibacterales bacterium]
MISTAIIGEASIQSNCGVGLAVASHHIGPLLNRVLGRGTFGHRAAVLTVGTVVAQTVGLLVAPLLTRRYTPAEFGIFGVYAAIVMTLSIVASGRFEIAIPLPGSRRTAARLLLLSIGITACATLAVAVMGLSLRALLSDLESMSLLVWAVPLTVQSAGLLQSLSYWAIRRGGFRALSWARIVTAILTGVVSLLLAAIGAQSVGLILGYLIGQVGGALILFCTEFKSVISAWRDPHTEEHTLSQLVREYRAYPLVNAPHALLDGLRDSGVAVVFISLFGSAANGFFSLGTRVLRAPIGLVAASLSQAYLADASRLRESGGLYRRTLKLMRLLAIGSAPLYVLVALIAPAAFAWIFGPEWRETGEYARLLAPGLYATMLVAPFAQLPSITGRMRQAMTIAVVDATARGVGLAVAGAVGSARLGVGLFSVISVLSCSYLAIWYLRLARGASSQNIARVGGAL